MADSEHTIRLAPRVLPRTDLRVARLGLGGAKLGGVFNDLNGRAAIELVQAAIDAGITFLDTSNLYAQGESEEIIGRAIARRRDQVTIASKAGYVLTGRKKFASRAKGALRPVVQRLGIKRTWIPGSVRGATLSQDFASRSLILSAEQSLRRLATDHLDVLFLHSPARTCCRQARSSTLQIAFCAKARLAPSASPASISRTLRSHCRGRASPACNCH